MNRASALVALVLQGCVGGGLSDGGVLVTVIESRPRQGERGVYPAPIEPAVGQVVRLTVEFSDALAPAPSVTLSGGGERRVLDARWADARHLEVLVTGPAFGGPPLADETTYALDLAGLKATDGRPLSGEGLVDGKLEFTTGRFDALLNHSCGHVQFGPFKSVAAADEPSWLAPRTDVPHTQYTVTLPAGDGGARVGYSRFEVVAAGRFTLFFGQPASVTLFRDDLGTPLEIVPTAAACEGIEARAAFHADGGEQLTLQLGATTPELKFIVEAEYE